MMVELSMSLAHSFRNGTDFYLHPAQQKVSVQLPLMQWNTPFNVCYSWVTVSNVTDLNCYLCVLLCFITRCIYLGMEQDSVEHIHTHLHCVIWYQLGCVSSEPKSVSKTSRWYFASSLALPTKNLMNAILLIWNGDVCLRHNISLSNGDSQLCLEC